jgi:hypothetical protein
MRRLYFYPAPMMRSMLLMVTFMLIFTPSFCQQLKGSRPKLSTHRHAVHTKRKSFGVRRYDRIGLALNALNYYGDLAPGPQRLSSDLSLTRPGIGLSYIRRVGPFYSIKVELMRGTIKGSDNVSANQSDGLNRYWRNASFRNRITELSVTAKFDLVENHGFYFHRHPMVLYVFGGLSIFYHNPQAKAPDLDLSGKPLDKGGQWVNLRPLGTEGQYAPLQPGDSNYGIRPYSKIQPAGIGGVGVRIKLDEVYDVSFEAGIRLLFTDYVDDVSKNYVDLGVLESDLSRAMSYRTNELGPPDQPHTYVGRDGNLYTVRPGYGSEHKDNMRGSANDNDFIFITTVRVTRILNAKMHRAKSR